MRTIAIDFETYYVKGEYSVKDLGNWRYCADERFDAFLLSVFDGSESWAGDPVDFNWDALEGATLVAHNAGFDSRVSRRLGELGRIPVLNNPWVCTANMTSCLFSARSLADALLVARKKRISKGVRDEMNKKHWKDICAVPGMREAVIRYGISDTVECLNLYKDFGHLWSPFEREVSQFTIDACARGVCINVALLNEYIVILEDVIFNLVQSFPWTKEGKKPTSPIAIAEQCRRVGIPSPPTKTKDEEGFDAWEMAWSEKFPWVLGAGQWRSLNKLLGSLLTLKERLRPDNTIDFTLLYFGGHTGRWSGGGSGFNMQNMRKEPLFIKDRAMVIPPSAARKDKKSFKQWVEACTDYQLDIRKLFIARPGKKFILSDASQIEPRVLNFLAGNHDLLEKIRNGFSYYEACAVMYKGWRGEPGTLKASLGDAGYTLLKNEMLGLGYGMGPDKFCVYAGVDIETAQRVVADFRRNNPRIAGVRDVEGKLVQPGIWDTLDEGFRNSCGGDFELVLPSGRVMTYRDVRSEVRTKRNKKTGETYKKRVFVASTGVERSESYGGLLTENLVQATAREVFATHLLEVEKTVGDVIFHVHDEMIVEVDQDVKPQEVGDVMSKAPDWLEGCPLSSEPKEAMHYLK